MTKIAPEEPSSPLSTTGAHEDNRLDAMAHISTGTTTTLSTTNRHDNVDLEAQAPPPTYTWAPLPDNIEIKAARPTELSHSDAARSLATTALPATTPQPNSEKMDTGGRLAFLWVALFSLFVLFMCVHMIEHMNGSPLYLLLFMAFFVVPAIVAAIWNRVVWYRMSPEERERKTRLDDLRKLVDKTKILNGKRTGTLTAGKEARELEILGQLHSWPEDEEWMKLVQEYIALQAEQAESEWVLRASAPIPTARPSRPVRGSAPPATVGGGK